MTSKVLFSSSLLSIGRFIIHADDEGFSKRDSINRPLFVFPRNGIWIRHEGKPAFMADTSIVNFYNEDQAYHRSAIDPAGDYCHWFSLTKEVIFETIGYEKSPPDLFEFQFLPCPRNAFIKHLSILSHLNTTSSPDIGWVEEQAIELLEGIFFQIQSGTARQKGQRRVRPSVLHLIQNIKEDLQGNISKNLSLADLSRRHSVSAYHLCRTFKRICGYGINQYRTEQRLRHVSHRLTQSAHDLATIAEELGFSSHSHLTSSYKNHFGYTPSEFRRYYLLS